MGQICGLGEINFQIGEEERKKSFPDEPIYTAGRTCAVGACGAPWPKLSRTFRGFNDRLEETGSEVSEESGNYLLPASCLLFSKAVSSSLCAAYLFGAEHEHLFLRHCLPLLLLDALAAATMLSRAMLPLTRPNVLASTVRVSTLPVNHARWYAKNSKPKKTPYKVPGSVKSPKPEQPANAPQEQYSTEQAEFDTKADPQQNSATNTSAPVSRGNLLLLLVVVFSN